MPINIKKEFKNAVEFLTALPDNAQGAKKFDYDELSQPGGKIPQGGFKYICHFEDKKWPSNVALAVPKLSDGSAKIRAEVDAMADVMSKQPKYNLIPFMKLPDLTFGCKTDPENTKVAGFLMQWIPSCMDGKPFVAARAKRVARGAKLKNNFLDNIIASLKPNHLSGVIEFFTELKPVWTKASIDDFQVLIDKSSGEVYTIDVDKLVGGGDDEDIDLVLQYLSKK